jgi:membrane-associated protease RseP (regulator of RpoE activity)
VKVWEESWGASTFAYYREILRLAREKEIPVLALNASRALRDAVREKGFDGLDPEDAERLPEVDVEDPYHRAFLEGMFAGHERGTGRSRAFQQVQVLWEETMAQTAAEYLASGEASGKRLVIIAGGNHVRYGFGIPRRLFRRLPLPYAIVKTYIAEISEAKRDTLMDVEFPALPMRPADIYWAVSYRDLEGDRVKLGILIERAEEGGVRVMGVMPGSPADAAGLEKGDVIVSAGGEAVREILDLTSKVGDYEPGDTGPVEVLRGEERLTFEVTYDVLRHGR